MMTRKQWEELTRKEFVCLIVDTIRACGITGSATIGAMHRPPFNGADEGPTDPGAVTHGVLVNNLLVGESLNVHWDRDFRTQCDLWISLRNKEVEVKWGGGGGDIVVVSACLDLFSEVAALAARLTLLMRQWERRAWRVMSERERAEAIENSRTTCSCKQWEACGICFRRK